MFSAPCSSGDWIGAEARAVSSRAPPVPMNSAAMMQKARGSLRCMITLLVAEFRFSSACYASASEVSDGNPERADVPVAFEEMTQDADRLLLIESFSVWPRRVPA
jgi:hypothetical protein